MEVTQTIDYALEKLQPVFDKLGDLGIAGWQIAVRQQIINGSYTIIATLAVLFTAISMIRRAAAKADTVEEDGKKFGYYDKDSQMCRSTVFFMGLGCFLLIASVISILFFGHNAVTQVFNPQWAAIQALMKLVH